MSYSSERRRALITGAGSGIGFAIAKRMLADGMDVTLVGRKREPLERVAALAPPRGNQADIHLCDLSDRSATDAMLEAVREQGVPDILVLNAGVSGLTELDPSNLGSFDEHLELNLTACFRIVRAFIDDLPAGGRVIAISSVLGRFGAPALHGYCASKSGLVGFVRALALEVAKREITVNAVLPAWVDTPMAVQSIEKQCASMGMTPEDARAYFESTMPIKRFLTPDEPAALVTFLASKVASGITGQAINVCGGTMA